MNQRLGHLSGFLLALFALVSYDLKREIPRAFEQEKGPSELSSFAGVLESAKLNSANNSPPSSDCCKPAIYSPKASFHAPSPNKKPVAKT